MSRSIQMSPGSMILAPLIGLAALLLAIVPVGGKAHADEAEKLAEFADIVGIEAQLEAIGAGMLRQMRETPKAAGDIGPEALEATVARNFDGSDMLAEMLSNLSGKIAPEDLDAALVFSKSDLGRRTTAAEVAMATSEQSDAVLAAGATLHAEIVKTDPDRAAANDRLKTATRMTENLTSITMNTMYGVLAGMTGSPAYPQVLSEDDILALVNAQSKQIRLLSQVVALPTIAYMYRDFTTKEINEYAAWFESPVGDAVNQSLFGQFNKVVSERMRAFGYEIMTLRGIRKT